MGKINQTVLDAPGAERTQKKGPGRPKGSNVNQSGDRRNQVAKMIADMANRAIKNNQRIIEYLDKR